MKETLNMPKTSFAMKGSLHVKEPKIQQEWKEQDLYNELLKKNEGNEKFIYLDGPPYANGNLHMGHAMNKILKDMIVRYKSMNGYYTKLIWGWDTHGLPIENALLKNKKIKRNELTDIEFRDLCKEYALKQVENQKTEFFRLGILQGEERPYLTLQPDYEAEQIKIFSKMVEKGLIYKGLKPVYWSPSSQSALADAEIEYKDKKSPAIYVAIKSLENGFEESSFVIWTTTPWTIPANNGVCLNPEIDYVHINSQKGKFIVAKSLLENVVSELELTDVEELSVNKGEFFENHKVKHPLFDKEFCVMLGDHVTEESGTGCVHTAGGHGEDDFSVSKKYGISPESFVDAFGKMKDNAEKYSGVFYEDANKMITQDLEENKNLLKLSFITHSYPHDWRTKKPVIYRATNQWFASINPVKKGILDSLNDVDFINDWARVRLYNMIDGREEWCISRQRKWGVPIPIFYTEKDSPILDTELINHVSKLFEEHGSNIWFSSEAKDLLPEGYTHPDSPNGIFTKEKDIMDVWFDSGSAHSAVAQRRLGNYHADLYIEGSDQYRGWFNSSLITGYIAHGTAPYKKLLSHGFVLDGKGNKMSKSLGNIIAPEKLCNTKGADIVRLWTASVDYQSDVRISDEIISQVSETYRRFRNTIRFMLGNLTDFEQSMLVEINELDKFDKYMMVRLDELIKNVRSSYDSYDFKKVVDLVNNYLTIELSSFYLDYIKDVTYVDSADSVARRKIQTVLFHHLNTLLKLMSPILVHTCYEAYQELSDINIHLEDFPVQLNIEDKYLKESADLFFEFRKDINKEIENLRNEKVIGKSFEVELVISPNELGKGVFDKFTELDLYLIVSKVTFTDNLSDGVETPLGKIAVKKYEGKECQRCRKYFTDQEIIKIELEDGDYDVCHHCEEIINTYED